MFSCTKITKKCIKPLFFAHFHVICAPDFDYLCIIGRIHIEIHSRLSPMKQKAPKPFVKWVGGKTQLLSDIEKYLPMDFFDKKGITYVEPFVGGGAVLFRMLQRFSNIGRAVINDINERLMITYKTVRDHPHRLIEALLQIQSEYLLLDEQERKQYFLKKREQYNMQSLSNEEIASLFIFLNRTCFNGLYRENSKGEFNVPHGKYVHPKICDEDTLLADSWALQNVEIMQGDFAQTLEFASPDTLYYFDPPYKPLSETSSFTSYSQNGFDDCEQIRLRDFCHSVVERNARFILSNSDVRGKNADNSFFDEIYHRYNITRVMAARMVNSNPRKRGKLPELIISNTHL